MIKKKSPIINAGSPPSKHKSIQKTVLKQHHLQVSSIPKKKKNLSKVSKTTIKKPAHLEFNRGASPPSAQIQHYKMPEEILFHNPFPKYSLKNKGINRSDTNSSPNIN